MSSCRPFLIGILLAAAFCFGCTKQEPPTPIDKSFTDSGEKKPAVSKKIRIALGGMVTPKEGISYYREFLDYIGKNLNRPVEYVDSEDYEEINRMLAAREIDAAFVCSGPYVQGKRKFGLELIAAPQAYGKPEYYSYIIVPRDSKAKTFADLKGKSFAFTDPLSNTGKIVPEYIISRMGEKPRSFFGRISYSGSHDSSIEAVSEGLIDGAAVDSLIYDYLAKKHPERTAKTRVLLKSTPYAPPPFVVHPSLDPVLKARLREVILNAHTSPEGRTILTKMMIDRFIPLEDSAYDSVREIIRWVERSDSGQ